MMMSRTINRMAQFGTSKTGNTCAIPWAERPAGDDVGNRDLVNIAPLQLGEEVVDLHSTSWGFASSAEDYLKSSKFAS